MKKVVLVLALVIILLGAAWYMKVWPFAEGKILTYTNSSIGYSFQYPRGWTVHEPSPTDASRTVGVTPPQGSVSPDDFFSVSIDPRTADQEIAAYKGVAITTKQVVIAGQTGTEITVTKTGYVTVVLPHSGLPGNNMTLWLESLNASNPDVQQMMQSFRFTK